jgi:hypothetical protein
MVTVSLVVVLMVVPAKRRPWRAGGTQFFFIYDIKICSPSDNLLIITHRLTHNAGTV